MITFGENYEQVKTSVGLIMNTIGKNFQAQTSLNQVNRDVANQQEKLSSAKKINKAEDDAVAYISSKKLESTIAGQEKAVEVASSAREEDMLSESIIAHSSANSVAIDTDFAKEQVESIRQKIMQDTTTAAMSHGNLNAASVLRFL